VIVSHDALRAESEALAERLVAWRRDLHRRPELAFEETGTAAFVADELRELKLEVTTGIAVTGVVGVLRAARRRGPAVLLRADMDALPIQEIAGRDYGSQNDGLMHACGHDGHTSMLLGAATLLAARRDALVRDVVFCFQPGEECGAGGLRMIEAGVLEIVETGSVYGLHLWSPFAAGTLHVRPGPTMAAQDEFVAVIRGRGGHGALPHGTLDPIVAAAQAVTALQTIVSRSVDPVQPAVVTIGSLHAGTACNIIPDEARMEGTLRSFDEDVRTLLRDRTRETLEYTARAAGCRLEFELTRGYPAVVNTPEAIGGVRNAAGLVFGESQVIEPAPMAAAEDFSYFLQQRPGAFMFVGAGNREKGITAPHHSPEFDIDESVLPRGAELLARLALQPEQPGDPAS
jgi:amidohydrolase